MEPIEIGAASIAALATGAGAPIWAAAIAGIIATMKSVPQLRGLFDGAEKLWSLILAAVFTLLAYVVAVTQVPPSADLGVVGIVLAVLAAFTVARLAMAFHDDVDKQDERHALTNPAGWTGK